MMKSIIYFALIFGALKQGAQAQIAIGSDVHLDALTLVSLDSLILVPAEPLDLLTDNLLTVQHTAIPGKLKPSVKKAYFFNDPLTFKGQVGIIYDPGQLNGNDEAQLELANSSSDENSIVTLSGSIRDGVLRFVSNNVTNLDLRILTLRDEANALPVTLVSFEARETEGGVMVTWKTLTEAGSDFYEIQRSGNAKDWQTLVRIPAAGDSENASDYLHRDNEPLPGQNYYRLKMVDRDGSWALSGVREVRLPNQIFTLFPNPAMDRLHLSDWSEIKKIRISDVNGQLVDEYGLGKSFNQHGISLGHLKAGIYILQAAYKNGTTRGIRFLKE